jgi:hypothetical protein
MSLPIMLLETAGMPDACRIGTNNVVRSSNGHFPRALHLLHGARARSRGARGRAAIAAAEHLRIIGNFRHSMASGGVTYPAPDGDYKAGEVLDRPATRRPFGNTNGW